MKIKKISASILFTLLMTNAFADCQIRDDNQQIIYLKKPAQRIISLAPDITETLFAIDAGKQIVGVIQGSDYPISAKKIPVVGSYSGVDLEKIISLHPDLIITWGKFFLKQLSLLKKWNIPIYVSDTHQLEDVAKTINNFGCLTGKEISANKISKNYLLSLRELKNKYQQQKKIKVFYQIGSYSLITINKNSWINQAIALCGGENIFANASFAAPEVTLEAVMNANPRAIISDAKNADWRNRWWKWKNIYAVKYQNLFSIDADLIDRASPRLILGVKKICSSLESARENEGYSAFV